jgi:L-alanine-DL-glutamate epimerase-like enolase superfamily enzyme
VTEIIELCPVRIPAAHGDYEAVIVAVRDPGAPGLEGLGEAPVVAGRTGPLAELVGDLRSGRPRSSSGRGALQAARLDLQARRRGVQLAELLGGVRRADIECSALVTDERPELVARAVEKAAAQGFSTFKIKAANGGGTLDQERLGAARWAAGPAGRIRIDFNGRMATSQAALGLRRLQPFRVELFEQPLPPEATLADWSSLREECGALVAADESLAEASLARELAAAGIALAPKVATVGGPEAVVELLRTARGPITIGSSLETSIGLAAALHVACALEAEPIACGLATRGRLDDDLVAVPLSAAPRLRLPGRPGLGVELDRRALRAYAVEPGDPAAARPPAGAVRGGPRGRRPARSRAGHGG